MGKSTISMAIFNSYFDITRQLRYSELPLTSPRRGSFVSGTFHHLRDLEADSSPPQQWRFTENYWGLLYIYIYIMYIYILIMYVYIYIDIHDDSWWFMMYILLHSSPWQFHHELHAFWIDCWNYVTKIRKHNESQWLFLWHQHTSRLS